VTVTCRELSDLLHDHVAGELSGPKRLGVRLHLLLCIACRAYASSYETTVRLARTCPDADLEGEELEVLVRAVLEASTSPD
jgi:anti-sigma factor RsiW